MIQEVSNPPPHSCSAKCFVLAAWAPGVLYASPGPSPGSQAGARCLSLFLRQGGNLLPTGCFLESFSVSAPDRQPLVAIPRLPCGHPVPVMFTNPLVGDSCHYFCGRAENSLNGELALPSSHVNNMARLESGKSTWELGPVLCGLHCRSSQPYHKHTPHANMVVFPSLCCQDDRGCLLFGCC